MRCKSRYRHLQNILLFFVPEVVVAEEVKLQVEEMPREEATLVFAISVA